MKRVIDSHRFIVTLTSDNSFPFSSFSPLFRKVWFRIEMESVKINELMGENYLFVEWYAPAEFEVV